MRDVLYGRTWELAAYLDGIESAVLEDECVTEDSRLQAVHTWRAKANVPPLLAPHINVDYLAWTALVEWSATDFTSRWRIEPHALKERFWCEADVTLLEALGGRGTRVSIILDIGDLDGRRGIETLAYQIVSVNLRKLVDAAVRKIETG
jgi:hypothetical protein